MEDRRPVVGHERMGAQSVPMRMSRRRSVAATAFVALLAIAAGFVWTTGTAAIARKPQATFAAPTGFPVEEATLKEGSEPELRGWIVERAGSCGVAALLHGRGSDRRSMIARARLLFDEGYSVALFDLSGHGESGGGIRGFGYSEGDDAARILNYVHERFAGRKIAAIGSSLGAAAFVFAEPRARPQAYVLEQLYSTLWETTALRAPLPFLRELQATVLLAQMPLRLGYDAGKVRPVDHMVALERPTLLLAGSADPFVDPSQSLALEASSKGNAKLVWFDGAGHVDLLRYDDRKYREAVIPFLRENLCSPAASS
ncbi:MULTISPECIES: alpha/beta hydrolase [unclassified Mesorhizobium]|uniref:alpha/beta hydrolase n=1 Tax=unclassified Mesorhizobium TaxID=325217 RepID=UPI0030147C5B